MNFTGEREKPEDGNEKKYAPITKYMVTDLITFSPDQNIEDVISIILEKKISGAPVLNDRRELVGIISEKDCLKLLIDEAYHDQHHVKKTVADYMTRDVATISVEMDVLDVANEFLNNHYRRFPVVENGILRGQVSRRDILRAVKDIKITTW